MEEKMKENTISIKDAAFFTELTIDEQAMLVGGHGDEVHPSGMPEDHKFGTLMLCPKSIPKDLQKTIGCDYSIPGYKIVHITIERES